MFKPVLVHFKFRNFASLPSEADQDALSELETDCNGNTWCLELSPGGDSRNAEPGWVGVYLHNNNDSEFDAKFNISMKDANGTTVKEDAYDCILTSYDSYGASMFIKRSTILDATQNILKDGALCIDVTIQVKDHEDYLYQPQSELPNKLLSMLESGEKSDVSFNVGGKVFPAHSQILHANAPVLANYCDHTIEDIDPEVFQILLEHIYSGRTPAWKDVVKHGKRIINAANKYELVQLKMAVENALVRERVMTKRSVADFILFADAQSCPLLKEYAISYFSLHYREILQSEHSKNLRASGELLSEILLLMGPGNEEAETTNVNELRVELGKRKLDVDGSKNALVLRLENAKRQKTDN